MEICSSGHENAQIMHLALVLFFEGWYLPFPPLWGQLVSLGVVELHQGEPQPGVIMRMGCVGFEGEGRFGAVR